MLIKAFLYWSSISWTFDPDFVDLMDRGLRVLRFGWGVVLASVSIGFLPCRRHSNPIHILPTLSMEFKVFHSGQQLDSTFYLSRQKGLKYGLRRVSHNIQCIILCIDKKCWLCEINWLGIRYFCSSLFWISLMFSYSNLNLLCMFSGFVPQNEQRNQHLIFNLDNILLSHW